MPQNKDELPAIRVYTVCDESRYLIVRNVPALGCGDELLKLFGSYGEIEECKPMDEEDCEPFTDIYWIKFFQVSNARFAKRKLDEFVFYGNRLQVSYAPHFESLSDMKEKLEGRRKEVLARLNRRPKGYTSHNQGVVNESFVPPAPPPSSCIPHQMISKQSEHAESEQSSHMNDPSLLMVSSNQEYFPSPSMNETVQLVRKKLEKIKSSTKHLDAQPGLKKPRVDNRRRI
ncbi:RNA-binding protein 48-like isoform X2 [Macadamia integrifolia]|uniref:RNA-binding protein 48-like isoform X2 n=1 Tax=Macadamia integrifolia TaxID=60698 RepID=UPI001C4F0026|nr:RNA-binding protein 48-like isoform X2 [Macadamia integrifolia]